MDSLAENSLEKTKFQTQQKLINVVNELIQEYPSLQQMYSLSCQERNIQKSETANNEGQTKGKQFSTLDNALQKYNRIQKETEHQVTLLKHQERLKASVDVSNLRKTIFDNQNLIVQHQKEVKLDGLARAQIDPYDIPAIGVDDSVLLSGIQLPQLPTKYMDEEEFTQLAAKRSFFAQQMKKKALELIKAMNDGQVDEIEQYKASIYQHPLNNEASNDNKKNEEIEHENEKSTKNIDTETLENNDLQERDLNTNENNEDHQ